MKIRILLAFLLSLACAGAYAQQGGVRGRVVSRDGRVALSNVKVVVEPLGLEASTDRDGYFTVEGLPKGAYQLRFEAPEYEDLDIAVRVDQLVKNLNQVVLSPDAQSMTIDDSVFAEFDSDTATDTQALPSSLSSSRDVFNNIASYKFSEMRFNVRGYDSQYSNIYLNGIRFNDALTGYGPWSLWSGLNDATRNQENTAGLHSSGFGIDGVGGTTNINARASQMRKGFRASVVNGNSMYRFRAMVSYASGLLDNGWSYALSFSTRQGGNSYVDGVYYNAYGYFGSVEKRFGGDRHDLALTVMGAPTERGAQQASTEEAYRLLDNNYYNPNVGRQMGKMRNTRVRDYHEPIVMLNYGFDIDANTKLAAAVSFRFGKNGYSALTWMDGPDPRPDYYRYLPSYQLTRPYLEGENVSGEFMQTYAENARRTAIEWMTMPSVSEIDFDQMFQRNYTLNRQGLGGNYMIEERHTDQRDFNFMATISHTFRDQSVLRGGVNARINRTEYYDEVKDLLGADYWLDVDKFARRDNYVAGSRYQNDLKYYMQHGEARKVTEGDKFSYDYYAHVRQMQLWAQYSKSFGGFSMNLGAEIGYAALWRQGRWIKGLFPYNSYGDSKKLDYATYKFKGEFAYRFSGAHALDGNITYMANAPYFRDAFVSARTRNTTTPGVDTEKVFGVDLSYNLTLPWITARLSGYYTTVSDATKVISFYDDTQSSYTNFAMSGIDKRFYGMELGVNVPIWGGISFNGALSLGDFTYTSNPEFTQTVDNSEQVVSQSRVLWKNKHVESTPQTALNLGLNYRGPHNWFASIDFNYYDGMYLSMNPARRTLAAYREILRPGETAQLPLDMKIKAINDLSRQEEFKSAYTFNLSVGKNWYIHRTYQLGFSLEIKNLFNNQGIRTGGYEQMRLTRRTYAYKENPAAAEATTLQYYVPFDSKYFYMLGTTYYLNVYFRF